ncbi:hypothetical protein TSO221_03540 [Azospirillum sp. TSO22-1]|nr:hypothetical protein TSO221_03540 [Azospirillum sp. TSO22-1]
MILRPVGGADLPAVSAILHKLEAKTGEVTLTPSGASKESLTVQQITLTYTKPSPAAQFPIPVLAGETPYEAEYPADTVHADNGTIHFGNCALPPYDKNGWRVDHAVFEGILKIEGGKLKIRGIFAEYRWPTGGGSPSGINKPG